VKKLRHRLVSTSDKPLSLLIFALVFGIALALFVATSREPVAAFQDGQVLHNGNPANGGLLCSECHNGGATPATIAIAGPAEVSAGSTATFAVTIGGGPGAVGGFNASASDHLGSFGIVDDEARLFFGEITHTAPKPFAGGTATFQFTWTAPEDAQQITLYVAGLSGNGNQTPSGDSVAATTKSVMITPASAVGDADGDGDIDADDVRAILEEVTGTTPSAFDSVAADMNSDGGVAVLDSLLLAQQLNP